jgi:addiction module HigA family antidote
MPMTSKHPGEWIREEILNKNDLSVTDAAIILKVIRPTLSLMLCGKNDLSPLMALRIERAFGVPMETLMKMQLAYDIEKTRKQKKGLGVRKFTMASASR